MLGGQGHRAATTGVWQWGGSCSPLELGRSSKAGKSVDQMLGTWFSSQLCCHLTLPTRVNLFPLCLRHDMSLCERRVGPGYSKHKCGKHGDVSHQASLLWNFVCLPQGMYAVVSTDRCSFCPLIGSMRGEPAREPASAQDRRLTASCCS